MSLPLKLNFSDYDNFLTEPNYTTSAEAQDYFRNMDMLVEALIDVGLWQPETNYPNGHVVFSPNMPNGTEAVCVATNGGKSSNTEPSWGEFGGDNVSDGTCFWKLRWKHWSKSVEEIADLTTGATNRLPNKAYTVGNVVYTDSNLSVALKCTTAGTTSNTELDISTVSVGESVTDGSAVWMVIDRGFEVATRAEAEAGISNNKVMTPLRVKQEMAQNTAKNVGVKRFTGSNAVDVNNVDELNKSTIGEYAPDCTNLPTYLSHYYNIITTQGNDEQFATQLALAENGKGRAYWRNKASGVWHDWQRVANNSALSMPSDQLISVSTNEMEYNAPANGWIYIRAGHSDEQAASGYVRAFISNDIGEEFYRNIQYGAFDKEMIVPISKGYKISLELNKCSIITFNFIYAQSEV